MALSSSDMSSKMLTEQPLPAPASPVVLPASSSHGGSRSEEESTGAITLMMLSRGIREESVGFIGDMASPNPADVAAAVSADVDHGSTLEQAVLPTQEVSVRGQTPAPMVSVVVPAQAPALEAEVMQSQDPVLPVSIPTQVAPALAVMLDKEAEAATASRKATRKRAACKKTVAEASEAPGQETASPQLLEKHECLVCGKGFKTTRGLSVHMNCHPDGRLHPCEFCGSTFPSTAALVSHVRRSEACGGNRPRKLSPIAAAALAFHTRVDLNLPEV